MKETIDCPKCDGKGYIRAFAHIHNGVCFCCNGRKTITIDRDKQIAKLSADTRTKAEWIMQSNEGNYAHLDYFKLLSIRNFCHGGWGLQDAYPDLLNHWFENGEAAFQAAQTERLR